MRILHDTHVYLWWLEDSPLVSSPARKLIDEAYSVYVSAASLWEAVITIGLGKLEADPAGLVAGTRTSGFTPLPITPEHTLAPAGLAQHHNDPFDRILLCQAMTEPLRLVTSDSLLQVYSDLVITV